MTGLDVSVHDDLGAWAIEERLDGAGEYLIALLQRERAGAEKLARLQAAIDEGYASGISERDPFELIKALRAGLRGSAMPLELSCRAQADRISLANL